MIGQSHHDENSLASPHFLQGDPNNFAHVRFSTNSQFKGSFNMTDMNKHDVGVLNGLIKTTIDSVDGYRAAAEANDSSRFVAMFFDRANERENVADRLQEAVTAIGGEPEDDGSFLAGVHRTFMGLKETVMGNDDKAIVSEVERGEDVIKAKYESALEDKDLSPSTRNLIADCYTSVKQGHDQMRDLKHSLEAQ
jgi:uncharacterized protein (TIGR02284 family)